MTSRRVIRGLWITAAGACIALGAGSGVAAAETGTTDGAGPSSPSAPAQPSVKETTSGNGAAQHDSTAAISQLPVTTGSPSGAAGGSPTTGGSGTKLGAKPGSTVSASTVTIRRDDAVTKDAVTTGTVTKDTVTKDAVTTGTAAAEPLAASPTVAPVEVKQPAGGETRSTPAAQPAVVTAVEVGVTPDVEPPAVAAGKADGTTDATTPVNLVAAAPAVPIVAQTTDVDPAPKAAVQALAAAAPVVQAPPKPGPIATVVISLLSAFGLLPPGTASPTYVVGIPAQQVPGSSQIDGVTGVKVGSSNIGIPVGEGTYTGAADWYFPTQADGTVRAQGVMWLQHGFLGSKLWYSALAQQLAQTTNSVVVVADVPSFPFFTCAGCSLSDVALQQGVGKLFVDPDRTALTASAAAAGYQGVLPEKFVLTGHSAGGALAATAGGYYSDTTGTAGNDLLGVVMFDGVSGNGTFAGALAALSARNVPVYQIAAPPQPWNANGQTTKDLVALRPGQFVGATLANGSHVDSLIGGSPIIDFVSQLLIRPSLPGNTHAVYTLASGWINDLYAGRGPADARYGTYGDPGSYVVLGQTAAVVLGPPPVVDVSRYLGTWYEVGSVRQFFSVGLVNTKAFYSRNPDGSIRVENSGNYFFDNGPLSTIVGVALPVDAGNDRLNVAFFGAPASADPPGNYWIVDLAPDYGWAVVTDPSGGTGFLLSRTPTVSAALYQELLDRASVHGVQGRIIPTPQLRTAPNVVTV